MIELKPCPFCGKEGRINKSLPVVTCDNDECAVFSLWFDVRKWNTRPIEDNLYVTVAGLAAMILDNLAEIERQKDEKRRLRKVLTKWLAWTLIAPIERFKYPKELAEETDAVMRSLLPPPPS